MASGDGAGGNPELAECEAANVGRHKGGPPRHRDGAMRKRSAARLWSYLARKDTLPVRSFGEAVE
jgi:hypothetical protein